jgi:hypothetical protein
MKVISGLYLKEDLEQRRIEVFKMNQDKDFIYGIDCKLLDKEEIEEFKKIVDKYYEDMKPFITKSFRKFKISKIDMLSNDDI